MLLRERVAYELGAVLVACPDRLEVLAGLPQAEVVVRTAADLVGIMLVLAVVFPVADVTDLERPALSQGDKPAAGTAVWSGLGAAADNHEGHSCILVNATVYNHTFQRLPIALVPAPARDAVRLMPSDGVVRELLTLKSDCRRG